MHGSRYNILLSLGCTCARHCLLNSFRVATVNTGDIFVKHASRKSFWHKFVPWLHNPEWNRFFSTIAAGVSLQYWWTHKSDKQIHDACSSIRFLSFESFGFFPLNEIICCSVAEIQRINLTYESTHLTQNENKLH